MKHIENWNELDKSTEVTEFPSLPVGPQICRILAVEDVEDKEYLKVKFDVADGEFKGFFGKIANNDLEKWSSQGTTYWSYKNTAAQFFRNRMTAIEKSNSGYEWNWNEKTLVNKLMVVNFGEEEYEKDGEIKVSIKAQEIRSIKALQDGDVKTLALKKLKKKEKEESGNTFNDILNQISVDDLNDEVPF